MELHTEITTDMNIGSRREASRESHTLFLGMIGWASMGVYCDLSACGTGIREGLLGLNKKREAYLRRSFKSLFSTTMPAKRTPTLDVLRQFGPPSLWITVNLKEYTVCLRFLVVVR